MGHFLGTASIQIKGDFDFSQSSGYCIKFASLLSCMTAVGHSQVIRLAQRAAPFVLHLGCLVAWWAPDRDSLHLLMQILTM